jgi:hypothetical protein
MTCNKPSTRNMKNSGGSVDKTFHSVQVQEPHNELHTSLATSSQFTYYWYLSVEKA